ncbi:MAG TPA: glycosyltransferase family 4 protein [Candidatus Methylacidiphilales bacterium]|nr:glycosyltransferase family 4 protein [Candidatus Methylacidiphilales bacterium]
MQVIYLANQTPWFGAHTGYEMLPSYVSALGVKTQRYVPAETIPRRMAGKVVSLLRGHGQIRQGDAFARAQLELALRNGKQRLGHILHGEAHMPYWRDVAPSLRQRSVLTLHQPPSHIGEERLQALAAYRHVIVPWRAAQDCFASKMAGGAVRFILHGADTDFFTPGPPKNGNDASIPPRALFSGLHLRNTRMLSRIVLNWKSHRGDLHFDLLIPPQGRALPGLDELRALPNVAWHAGLSDNELRELYRKAYFLLLPMQDSGANTAVIEALACGLPIITTDVGGIRDYGGGALFPVVKNDDDDGMMALMEDYLARPAWRDEVGTRLRAFAEAELQWPVIARQHLGFYREISP